MKFYKSTSAEFSFQAPRCQDSFRSSFPGPMPSSVRVPMKQHILLETVSREHIQILSYVHFFLNAIEKMANKLESTMLSLKNSTKDQAIAKEFETMLSGLQIQFSCISSIEKALENVTDNSIAASCNLQLTRRDTVLKSLCKRSEARTSVSRNSSSPIPGRLVVKGKLPTPVHEPDKRTPSYSPGTRVRDKLRKVRTRTYTKNRFPWLPF